MTTQRKAMRFQFEGEQLTLREIKVRVPALSATTIQKHIEQGRTTRREMLIYDGHRRSRAASIANAAKIKTRLY